MENICCKHIYYLKSTLNLQHLLRTLTQQTSQTDSVKAIKRFTTFNFTICSMFSHPKLDKPATRRDIEELKDCIAGLTEIVCQLTVVRKRDERTPKASRKRQRRAPQRQVPQLESFSSSSEEEPANIEEPALESQEGVTPWP